MKNIKWLNWSISILLISLGVISIVLNAFFEVNLAVTWPIAMMMLGVAILMYAGILAEKIAWVEILYIPGALVLMLGVIFLLNILTGDWNAWAYAWLLILCGLGLGVVLANRTRRWPEVVSLVSIGVIIGGAVFFVAFGALSGGLFIQIAAPLILILGGFALYRLNLKEDFLERFILNLQKPASDSEFSPSFAAGQQKMVEALTERELQVLTLIDLGLSNAEIAERLTLAPSTVKTHINNIYGKLGVQSRIRAIRQARAMGLIKPSTKLI